MSIHTQILERHTELHKHTKLILCDKCRAAGNCHYGECPRCLRNYADAKDWLETHTFKIDTGVSSYHDTHHDAYKALPLRLPHEHPMLYYGFELEVTFDPDCLDSDDYYDDDDDEYHNDSVEEIIAAALDILDVRAVAEYDGSVSDGAEIITPPMSYGYITSPAFVERLEKFTQYLEDHGALITQPDGNGMHVHISRDFFRTKKAEKYGSEADAIRNLDWYFQKFQPEIEKLGGREYRDYCNSKIGMARHRLSTTFDGVEITGYKLNKSNLATPNGDHNYAVITSGPTIEVRVFKSTLDYKHILANIELVRNLAHAARENITKATLDTLLHTKENKFLDDHIVRTRHKMARTKQRQLELASEYSDTIELTIK